MLRWRKVRDASRPKQWGLLWQSLRARFLSQMELSEDVGGAGKCYIIGYYKCSNVINASTTATTRTPSAGGGMYAVAVRAVAQSSETHHEEINLA